MGLPTRKYQATPKDVRAIVNGSYPGDPHAVIQSMASTLAQELSPLQKPGHTDALLSILVRQLEDWLGCDANLALPEEKATALPVTMWSPAEVVAKQKLSALTTLYRYDKAGKLYCVKPSAKQNGRMFPAWQFVDPVPSLLPHVITELRGVLQFELHAFFVTQQDDLNELSPAEMLAGLPFENRGAVSPAQARLLSLPTAERLQRVLALARYAGRGMTD